MGRKKRHAPPTADDQRANAERKKELIDQLRARHAERAAPQSSKASVSQVAVPTVHPTAVLFRRTSLLEVDAVTDGLASLVRAFRQAASTRESVVVLAWPEPAGGVASVHGISMLCELAEGPDRVRGLTTLFFPASARTGASQKSLLVDRDWLLSSNRPWLAATLSDLKRGSRSSGYTRARYHAVLSLLGALRPAELQTFKRAQAIVRRDSDRTHPTLHELVARRAIKADGSLSLPEESFLVRSRKLSRLLTGKQSAEDHQRVEAVEPSATPWLLSTIHGASPSASWKACSSPSNRRPEIILLDLQYRARARLGEDWRSAIKDALSKLSHGDTELPVMVVTDSPFVANFARFELLPGRSRKTVTKPAPTRFCANSSAGLLASQQTTSLDLSADEAIDLQISLFASDLAAFESDARQLSRDTAGLSAGAVSRSINRCLGRLRAVANCPLSIAAMHDQLAEADDEDFERGDLESLNMTEALSNMMQSSSRADRYENDVVALTDRARALAQSLSSSAASSVGTRLKERVRSVARRANRTLLVAQHSGAARMLESWLSHEPDLDEEFRRLGEKFDIVAPKRAVDELELAAETTRPFGHMLLLSTPPREALSLLLSSCCPKNVELLYDFASARFLADYAEKLSALIIDGGADSARLKVIVDELRDCLGSDLIRLPNFDFDLSGSSLSGAIDLRENSGRADSKTFRIETTDGEEVFAWGDSQLVVRKPSSVTDFEVRSCASLKPGQEVLIPRPEFLDAIADAKELRAAAAPLLDQYHECIRREASLLPGQNLREKAGALHRIISEGLLNAPTEHSVLRWLDIEGQMQLPPELRVPQAPRTYLHFMAFMRALKVNDALAETFWLYGIMTTRSRRIRSGFAQRRLYVSALIDPDALERQVGCESGLVEFIRELAEQFIIEVSHIKRVGEKKI